MLPQRWELIFYANAPYKYSQMHFSKNVISGLYFGEIKKASMNGKISLDGITSLICRTSHANGSCISFLTSYASNIWFHLLSVSDLSGNNWLSLRKFVFTTKS